jgi:NAD(P)H-hydrate epimerase
LHTISSNGFKAYSANPVAQTLGAKAAAALDQELMSTGAFSIDQLMELAGLAVSQAGRYNQLKEATRLVVPLC